MVPISEIRAQNAKFASERQSNDVCVFVGATNGIGESILKVVSTLLVTPTIYVVGRSASRWETQHRDLCDLNDTDSKPRYVFVEADVSTICGVDEACKQLKATASKVDYLCMSAGYFPLVGRIGMRCPRPTPLPSARCRLMCSAETPEGLEQCFTLSYWARIRFLHNLLQPLRRSPRPRVMSIFTAGYEGPLREDDMDLAKNWSIPNFAYQVAVMKTLAFYRFAAQYPDLTLIHTWPGFVLTGRERKPRPDPSASFLWRWTFALLEELGWFYMSFRAIPEEESGQRHAFLLTNHQFTPGVWRFNEYCEVSPRSTMLEKYREEGKPDKVWDFTVATWDKALGTHKP